MEHCFHLYKKEKIKIHICLYMHKKISERILKKLLTMVTDLETEHIGN